MTPNTYTFSEALKLIKSGKRLARLGWNGISKGLYVVYQKGYPDGIPINKNTADATGLPEGSICTFQPYLMFHPGNNNFVPWVISQTDVLSDNWFVIE